MRSNSTWLRCKTIDLNRNSTCWNIKQNGNKETNECKRVKKVNLVHKQCKFDIFNGNSDAHDCELCSHTHIVHFHLCTCNSLTNQLMHRMTGRRQHIYIEYMYADEERKKNWPDFNAFLLTFEMLYVNVSATHFTFVFFFRQQKLITSHHKCVVRSYINHTGGKKCIDVDFCFCFTRAIGTHNIKNGYSKFQCMLCQLWSNIQFA